MKKNILLAIGFSLLALASCTANYDLDQTISKTNGSDTDTDFNQTQITLNSFAVVASHTIVSQALHVPVIYEGTTNVDLSTHTLKVKITNLDTQDIILDASNHRNIQIKTYVVKPGRYQISAETANLNGQLPSGLVGFNQPRFAMVDEILIEEGQAISYDLVAKQSTAAIKVNFSGLFESYYPCLNDGEKYHVEITASNGAAVTFASGEERAAYFQLGDDEVTIQSQILLTFRNSQNQLETVPVNVPESVAMPTGALQAGYLYDAVYTVLGQ